MTLLDIINKLEAYPVITTIVIALIPALWAFFKFKEYLRDKRFTVYHQLIKELVEPEEPGIPLKLDRQIAIVYELRNFPEYYEISRRILEGLKEDWKEQNLPRIIKEIDISLEYINKNKICKFMEKICKYRY